MATKGDMIGETVSLSAGSYLTLKPLTTDEEWVIHNIYINIGDTVEVYRWNSTLGGSPLLKITAAGYSLLSQHFHCSTIEYIQVKNAGASSIYVSYDGIVTNT